MAASLFATGSLNAHTFAVPSMPTLLPFPQCPHFCRNPGIAHLKRDHCWEVWWCS